MREPDEALVLRFQEPDAAPALRTWLGWATLADLSLKEPAAERGRLKVGDGRSSVGCPAYLANSLRCNGFQRF